MYLVVVTEAEGSISQRSGGMVGGGQRPKTERKHAQSGALAVV